MISKVGLSQSVYNSKKPSFNGILINNILMERAWEAFMNAQGVIRRGDISVTALTQKTGRSFWRRENRIFKVVVTPGTGSGYDQITANIVARRTKKGFEINDGVTWQPTYSNPQTQRSMEWPFPPFIQWASGFRSRMDYEMERARTTAAQTAKYLTTLLQAVTT
jgi:hypothetical protein